MESIDKTVNAIASARFVLERTTANSVCKELRFVLQVLLDEAYEAGMESREAYERLEFSHAELWKEHLAAQEKTEETPDPEPQPESGLEPQPEQKPDWIVEKPVPVGSEAAKRIIAKVAADNPPPKKKGRPRKNDD